MHCLRQNLKTCQMKFGKTEQKGYIKMAVTDDVLTDIKRLTIAYAVWEKLTSSYENRTPVNQVHLMRKLVNMELDESKPASEHLNAFTGDPPQEPVLDDPPEFEGPEEILQPEYIIRHEDKVLRNGKLMEAVMGGDKAAQERLKAKAEEAEAERQAVLAAMEAEKENPALRYDDKKMRTISDVKYSKIKKSEARKKLRKEDSLPDYVVEGLDDELKHIIIETCEVQKGSHAKGEANFELKSFIENTTQGLKSGNRVNKGALAMTFHKQELGLHQTRVRHKPVLERQLLHLRAIKSIQDYVHNLANNL
ncbi:hypothetical protein L7F22_061607 [Adiantum nelumboides]|nr:hypothetical protein [Adiantum nelumboides]